MTITMNINCSSLVLSAVAVVPQGLGLASGIHLCSPNVKEVRQLADVLFVGERICLGQRMQDVVVHRTALGAQLTHAKMNFK